MKKNLLKLLTLVLALVLTIGFASIASARRQTRKP